MKGLEALEMVKSFREGFIQNNDWVTSLETLHQELDKLNKIREVLYQPFETSTLMYRIEKILNEVEE